MKLGDKVAVVNDTIKGKVIQVSTDEIVIEDEHGFERTYHPTELVISKGNYKFGNDQLYNKELNDKIKAQINEHKRSLSHFEVDLHIEELVDSHSHMTNHEILMKQMGVCKSFVQKSLDSNTKRIVLIHGKGEGVLKAEIHAFLNKLRYLHEIGLEYHDASYSEYGMGGATEVIFH
ncbi:Smr/MutS family protein [Paracrocinitomix mangrovi]|uniref:Smr/MutS family protein n=1 Tax=Paracrocinitomix mangrovi TaxID=2862509 RepID=UPI001C8DFC8E|nr:Smr/MutS family protein [Paracrocinitomix mangrovi]UKN02368.1 Smr/MutS family protein [Paracrocinitomix mangrovi]